MSTSGDASRPPPPTAVVCKPCASASKGAACTTARRRAVAASTRVAAPSYLADGAGRGGTGGAAAQGLHTTAVGGGGRLASPDVDMRLRLAVSGGFRACCGAARGDVGGALGRWDFEAKMQAARRLLAAQASQAPRPFFFALLVPYRPLALVFCLNALC